MRVRLSVSPMASYSEPSYPRRDIVLDDPSLLTAHRPNRWKKVALSAAFALLTGAGCSDIEDNGKAIDPSDDVPPIEAFQSSAEKKATSSLIAPLFLHGRGIEGYGCLSVTPPNFLSEADACELISSVFKEHGLSFRSDVEEKISLTITGQEPIEERWIADPEYQDFRTTPFRINENDEIRNKKIDFSFDGIDDEKRIAYEYISNADHYSLKSPLNYESTVEEFYFRVAAARLGYLLEGKTQHAVGIFYDPTAYYYKEMSEDPELVAAEKELNSVDRADPDYAKKSQKASKAYDQTWLSVLEKHSTNAQKESKELLRLQVLDFIEWLKAQGVIQ